MSCKGVGSMKVGSGPVGGEVCDVVDRGPDIILTQGARRKLTERGIRWANVPDGRSDLVHHGGQRVQHVSTVMNMQFRPIHEEHREPDPRGGKNGVVVGEAPTGVVKYRFRDYRNSLIPSRVNVFAGNLGGGAGGGGGGGYGGGSVVDEFGNPVFSGITGLPIQVGPTCPIWLPTSSRVLVLGGYGNQITPIIDFIPFYGTNMAEIYDVENDSWEEVANPPNQADRTDAEAVTLLSGKVLIMGGHAMNSGSEYTSVELFDPIDETFHLVPLPSDSESAFGFRGPVLLSGSSTHGHVMVSRGAYLYKYNPSLGASGTFVQTATSTALLPPFATWPCNWNIPPGIGNGIQLLTGEVFYFKGGPYAVLYNPTTDVLTNIDTSLWPSPIPNGQGLVLGNGNVVFRDGVFKRSDLSWTLHNFTTFPSLPGYTSLQPDPAFLPDDRVLFIRNTSNQYEVHPGIYNPYISCSTGVFTNPDPTGSWSTGSNGPGAGQVGMGHDNASVIGLGDRTVLWTGGYTYDVPYDDPLNASLSRKATVFSEVDSSFVTVSDMLHQRIDHVSSLIPYTTPFPKGHLLDSGTVALWRLDEASPSNDLVAVTGSYVVQQFGGPQVVAGKINGSRHTDNTHYLQGNGDAVFGKAMSSSWSIEMWVNPDVGCPQSTMFIYNGLDFSFVEADINLAELGRWADGRVYFNHHQNLSIGVTHFSSGTFPENAWSHIALTRENQRGNLFTYRIYISGTLDSVHPDIPGLDFDVPGNNHFIGMGCYIQNSGIGTTPGSPFYGKIDDTRISKVLRSGVEIKESYNRGSAIRGPKNKPWKTGPDLPFNTIAPAISRLSTGELIITGGDDAPRIDYPGVYNSNNVAKISPNGQFVTTLPSMISSRSYHSQITLPDDSIFVVGGSQTQFGSPTVHHAELFVTGVWHETSIVPTLTASSDFYDSANALMKDGRVAVIGGVYSPRPVVAPIHHAYNRVTNQWDDIGTPAVHRHAATLDTLSDGRLLMVGGVSVPNSAVTMVTSSELWNSGSWITIQGPDTAVYQHSSIVLNNGSILIVGGRNSSDLQETNSYLYTPNAGTGSWERVGDLPYPVDTYESPAKNIVKLDDGRVVVVLGAGAGTTPQHGDKVSVYYPDLKKWVGWRNLPGRYGNAVIGKLSRNRIIHLGGDLDDTYTYTSGSRVLDL